MSFSPRNVSQLIVGTETALADAAAYKTKVDAGTIVPGEFAVIPIPIIPVPSTTGDILNKGFRIIARTSSGDKVSDTVLVDNISSKTEEKAMTAAVLGAVDVTIATPASGDFIDQTFKVVIDKHDHIGSMLNDRFLSAYVACDKNGDFLNAAGTLVTATANDVAAELRALLASTVALSGREFVISGATSHVIITEVAAKQLVGVADGINLPWEVVAGVTEDDIVGGNYVSEVFAQSATASKPSDLVQMKNVEWFNSGYSKDAYRETGYPYSFQADSTIVAAGLGATENYSIFQFYKDRDSVNIERQHRQLIAAGTALTAAITAVIEDAAL